MKISMLLVVACTLVAYSANSQIGVGSLKGKVVDKTNKKEKEPQEMLSKNAQK